MPRNPHRAPVKGKKAECETEARLQQSGAPVSEVCTDCGHLTAHHTKNNGCTYYMTKFGAECGCVRFGEECKERSIENITKDRCICEKPTPTSTGRCFNCYLILGNQQNP